VFLVNFEKPKRALLVVYSAQLHLRLCVSPARQRRQTRPWAEGKQALLVFLNPRQS